MSKKSTNPAFDLYDIPFDQYSRQYYANEIIEAIRRHTSVKQFSILDIGGYKGRTIEFQKDDKITIADLVDVDDSNYVKVDGKKLPFDVNSYDITVSFDTYEHIQRSDRSMFIEEALRVSRSVHVLSAPFDNDQGNVYEAELFANETYKSIFGYDHQWLKEHMEYGIPTTSEFEAYCNKVGIAFFKIKSNDIHLWLRLQQVFFTAEKYSKIFPSISRINHIYNENMLSIESMNSNTTYHTTYCLSRNRSLIENIQHIHKASIKEQDVFTTHSKMFALDTAISSAYQGLVH